MTAYRGRRRNSSSCEVFDDDDDRSLVHVHEQSNDKLRSRLLHKMGQIFASRNVGDTLAPNIVSQLVQDIYIHTFDDYFSLVRDILSHLKITDTFLALTFGYWRLNESELESYDQSRMIRDDPLLLKACKSLDPDKVNWTIETLKNYSTSADEANQNALKYEIWFKDECDDTILTATLDAAFERLIQMQFSL